MSRLGTSLAVCYSVFAFYMRYDAQRNGCEGMANIPAAIGVLPALPVLAVLPFDATYCDLPVWILAYLLSTAIIYGAGALLERGGRWVAGKMGSR